MNASTTVFDFSKLAGIYQEAIVRNEPTLAFEVQNGRGRFLFLMFFDAEDAKSKDRLFLFLRNTKVLCKLDLYGSHRKGVFTAYITPGHKQKIMAELGLRGNGGAAFVFADFLERLNEGIPDSLPLSEKIKTYRDAWSDLKNDPELRDAIDESAKTILIGERRLSVGKPREKTLRKLYLYAADTPENVSELISNLKKVNMTVAWTSDPNLDPVSVRELLQRLR